MRPDSQRQEVRDKILAVLEWAQQLVTERSATLAQTGHSVFQPTPEDPAYVLMVDEVDEVVASIPGSGAILEFLASKQRKSAVCLILATQRATQKQTGGGMVRANPSQVVIGNTNRATESRGQRDAGAAAGGQGAQREDTSRGQQSRAAGCRAAARRHPPADAQALLALLGEPEGTSAGLADADEATREVLEKVWEIEHRPARIMSGEEEKLYARAEMLEETGDLAQAVTGILTGAQGAGVDPRAVISLTAALQTLDPGASAGYAAGGRKDRQDGSGYGSDGEFLEALSGAEDQVREHLREVKELREQVLLAADRAQQDLEQGRRDLEAARAALAAAYAMSTREPFSGCHGAKAAAIAAAEAATAEAEARIRDAERRIGICAAAADILGPLTERLVRALGQLRTVPQDLGEVYELIYEFVRSGGKLPRYARWIEGANA